MLVGLAVGLQGGVSRGLNLNVAKTEDVPPLAGYQTVFPKGKKQGNFLVNQDYTLSEFLNDLRFLIIPAGLLTHIHLCPVFYTKFG